MECASRLLDLRTVAKTIRLSSTEDKSQQMNHTAPNAESKPKKAHKKIACGWRYALATTREPLADAQTRPRSFTNGLLIQISKESGRTTTLN